MSILQNRHPERKSILFSFSQAQTKILGYAMQNQQEQMQQKTKAKKEYKANEAFFFDKEKKQQVIKADIFFKLNKDEMVNVLKDIQAIEILQTQRDLLNKLSKYRDSKKKTINSKIESLDSKIESLEKQLEKEKAIKVGFDEFEKLIAQKLA